MKNDLKFIYNRFNNIYFILLVVYLFMITANIRISLDDLSLVQSSIKYTFVIIFPLVVTIAIVGVYLILFKQIGEYSSLDISRYKRIRFLSSIYIIAITILIVNYFLSTNPFSVSTLLTILIWYLYYYNTGEKFKIVNKSNLDVVQVVDEFNSFEGNTRSLQYSIIVFVLIISIYTLTTKINILSYLNTNNIIIILLSIVASILLLPYKGGNKDV